MVSVWPVHPGGGVRTDEISGIDSAYEAPAASSENRTHLRFAAIIVGSRRYAFHSDRPGVAGTVATVVMLVMLSGGAIALCIGFRSLD